ncbi:MAG: acetyl-CoA carboxylase carboxyltransferase subunit alpha [Rhodospirillales bacterium]|nr:MAG: acetyl-CoA carboxylase carboxyltransferase subunit alpha [Rhodospirillales bacterium]
MKTFLEFEQPIAELEGKIEELRHLADVDELNIVEEISKLTTKKDRIHRQLYQKLDSWQKVQVARHPERPHFGDYVGALVTNFQPLAGDRAYAEDSAIIGGIGRFRGYSCMFIGHEKGNDTASRVKHNFGMARPEGYRKAIRLMELADHFQLPVVTLVDTPGAYPGVGAEERGQAEAIARSIESCLKLRVPMVSAIIGEGGSGGAIALATANTVLMLEHAIYSVISPEGCASILWRESDETTARSAADAMKVTAQDLLKLGIVDKVVREPFGGAHSKPDDMIEALGDAIEEALGELRGVEGGALRARRREKFLEMGRKGLT